MIYLRFGRLGCLSAVCLEFEEVGFYCCLYYIIYFMRLNFKSFSLDAENSVIFFCDVWRTASNQLLLNMEIGSLFNKPIWQFKYSFRTHADDWMRVGVRKVCDYENSLLFVGDCFRVLVVIWNSFWWYLATQSICQVSLQIHMNSLRHCRCHHCWHWCV